MPNHLKVFLNILFSFLVTVLTAGCSPVNSGPSGEVRSALEGYLKEGGQLAAAVDSATDLCMKDAGFDVYESINSTQATLLGLEGLFSSRSDAEGGYLETIKIDGPGSEDSEYKKALNGSDAAPRATVQIFGGATVSASEEGCFAEGRRKVFGSVEKYLKYFNFINTLTSAGSDEVDGVLDEIQGEFSTYKTCMKENGVSVEKLGDPGRQAEERYGKYRKPHEKPKQEEIDAAVADYTCQEKSGLAKKANQEYLKAIGNWLVDNESLVLEIRDIGEAAKKRAAQIANGE